MAYTLGQLRTEVYEHSGDDSQLDPAVSANLVRLDKVINEGQRRVAFYKNTRGRRVRFPQLFGQLNFQTSIVQGLVSVASANTVTLDGSAGAETDRYKDWLVRIGGQTHLVTDYQASRVATVAENWVSVPTGGEAYTLFKRHERLLPAGHSWALEHVELPVESSLPALHEGRLLEVMKIVDLADQRELDHAVRGEFFDVSLTAIGPPRSWYRFGNIIEFDNALDEERWYRMEYYRAPTEMVAEADVPEIDEVFHWGIVLWCRWWSFIRQQETQLSSQAESDFRSFMNETIAAKEAISERDRGPRIRVVPRVWRGRR